jgi:hypothetical protein
MRELLASSRFSMPFYPESRYTTASFSRMSREASPISTADWRLHQPFLYFPQKVRPAQIYHAAAHLKNKNRYYKYKILVSSAEYKISFFIKKSEC